MLKKSKIRFIKAKEIFDSNRKPTVGVELKTDFGVFQDSVPSGISKGKYEAVEKEAKTAVKNINQIIAPRLIGRDSTKQKEIDEFLIKLDGTKNKSKLGANAILPISIAVCRAGAAASNLPLYQYIRQLVGENGSPITFPRPCFNMIEGGKHAKGGLLFQEFLVVPQKYNFAENFQIGKKIYQSLGEILKKNFVVKIKKSAEGAYIMPSAKISDAINSILKAAEKIGEKSNIRIAIDVAASSFVNFSEIKDKFFEVYKDLIEKYPVIISIEDPFEEEDWEGWRKLMSNVKAQMSNVLIIGDDLTVTNPERIKKAHRENACNGVIIKPNQIGTITETLEAAKLAKKFHWRIMVSNRAGETEDDFIADLAVGIGAEFIKSGAPFPKERMAKYNRLLAIEKEINRDK